MAVDALLVQRALADLALVDLAGGVRRIPVADAGRQVGGRAGRVRHGCEGS